jgi:hypothetical protein
MQFHVLNQDYTKFNLVRHNIKYDKITLLHNIKRISEMVFGKDEYCLDHKNTKINSAFIGHELNTVFLCVMSNLPADIE